MGIRRELPEDVLADILRRLPPRSLAASRCVCRAWREAIDAARLLRADLLPLSVRGIFMSYCALDFPEFFSRPTTGPAISGDLDFIPGSSVVKDHCNGLLLIEARADDRHYAVVNPATRRWAWLPRFPPASSLGEGFDRSEHLVYDPMASPHYEVFLIPILPYQPEIELDPDMLQSEWPPSSYPLQVFSSLTGVWEQRLFAREGDAVGTIADMKKRVSWGGEATYWRGVLYLYHHDDSFISVFMANAKYRLVPVPTSVEFNYHGSFSLGRSEKGVYCAFNYDGHGLWIFSLNESCDQSEWLLEHHVNLETFARKLYSREDYERPIPGPWILQDINEYKYVPENDKKKIVEERFEWNSDDDNVLNTEDMVEGHFSGSMYFIGFHPFKEVVFLNASITRGIAYHRKTSKFQDLGNIYPTDYIECAVQAAGVETCFIFTPCWMEDFPETKWDTDIEN